MQLKATVRDETGATRVLPPVLVNDGATKDQVVQQLSQRGYQVVDLGRLPESSTTTTPISGVSLPRAIGQTVLATGQRAFGAARRAAEMVEGGAALQHPLSFAGQALKAATPALAPELILPGMAAETFARTRPGTGAKEAEQAAAAGQMGAAAVGLPLALGQTALRGARAVASTIPGRLGRKAEAVAAPAEATFAGVREGAIAKGLSEALEKSGGAVDAQTFAKRTRPALRAMMREASRTFRKGNVAQREAVEPSLTSLRSLVGRTVSLGPVANAVAKDPAMLATLLRQGGPELLPELQAAWLTGTISAATGKAGLARGTLNPAVVHDLWTGLGEAGQTTLFGTRAPALRRFFDTIAETAPAAAGAAPEAVKAAGASRLVHGLEALGLLGGAIEVLGGHALRGIGVAGVPLVLGKFLLRNGGAEWLTDVARATKDARLFAQMAPALRQTGLALLAQAQAQSAAPPRRPGLPLPPPPPPAAAPAQLSRNPGLDTPEGIMAAIQNTRLGPGWRPGRPPAIQ